MKVRYWAGGVRLVEQPAWAKPFTSKEDLEMALWNDLPADAKRVEDYQSYRAVNIDAEA